MAPFLIPSFTLKNLIAVFFCYHSLGKETAHCILLSNEGEIARWVKRLVKRGNHRLLLLRHRLLFHLGCFILHNQLQRKDAQSSSPPASSPPPPIHRCCPMTLRREREKSLFVACVESMKQTMHSQRIYPSKDGIRGKHWRNNMQGTAHNHPLLLLLYSLQLLCWTTLQKGSQCRNGDDKRRDYLRIFQALFWVLILFSIHINFCYKYHLLLIALPGITEVREWENGLHISTLLS